MLKRKLRTITMSCLVLTLICLISMSAMAEITPTEPTDMISSLRTLLIDKYDTDGDGELSDDEIANITSLDIDSSYNYHHNINQLQYLPSLKTLTISNVSQLQMVNIIGCDNLESIYLSDCTNLNGVNIHDNPKLTTVSFQNCFQDTTKPLRSIVCYLNENLATFTIGDAKIKILQVTSSNALTTLDLTPQQDTLQTLHCNNNSKLETITGLEDCTVLTLLDIHSTNIATLDVTKMLDMEDLRCNHTRITTLDVSNLTKLDNLYCDRTDLISLDVSKCTNLETMYCFDSALLSLEASKNTQYNTVYDQRPYDTKLVWKEQTDGVFQLDLKDVKDASGTSILNDMQISKITFGDKFTKEGSVVSTKTPPVILSYKYDTGNEYASKSFDPCISLYAPSYVRTVKSEILSNQDYRSGDTVNVVPEEVLGSEFIGWEIEGFTLTSDELKDPTLSFTMPDSPFIITATYKVISAPSPATGDTFNWSLPFVLISVVILCAGQVLLRKQTKAK